MKPENEDKTEEEKLEEANKAAAKQNIANIEKDRPEPKPIVPPGSLVDKPLSLMDQMAEVNKLMKGITEMDAKKLKKKSIKMPFKVKKVTRNLTKMMVKNKVQVFLLKLTGDIQITIGEINTGRLIVGEMYWNAADDIIWRFMGKTPTAIVCEWDMQPLTKKRLMDDTNKLKTWLHPQTIIIRAIEAKEAAEKSVGKGMKPMMLIVIAVVLIIAYYLFFGG